LLLSLYTRMEIWWGDLRRRAHEERGASAVEYGLLVALIAAVIVAVVRVVGSKTSNSFSSINANLP
jgi:pilus assembly protein Flp/PilA